jgi:uncharacterized membrane protein (UPF0127 family)
MKRFYLRLIFPLYRFFRTVFPNKKAEIMTPSKKTLSVEMLTDRVGRALGLSYRSSFPKHALLFVFPIPGKYFFHMIGMKFPIYMVFLNSDAKVVFVAYHQTPGTRAFPKPPATSPVPAQYVLEIPAMSASHYGLVLGSQVVIHGL